MAKKGPKGPRKYDPQKHCGCKRRSDGKPCVRGKGEGTLHKGSGNCRWHGGQVREDDKRFKAGGRYSKIKRRDIREIMDEMAKEKNPMDMLPEVLFLRAHVQKFVDQGKQGAKIDNDYVNTMSGLVDKIGKMIERIHKIQTEGAITRHAFLKYNEQMALVVAKIVEPSLMEKIETGWQNIMVDIQ